MLMDYDLVSKQNALFGTMREMIKEQRRQLNEHKKLLRQLYNDIDQLLQTEFQTDASTLTARVYSSLSSGNKSIDSLAVGLTDIREALGRELQ